MFTVLYKSRMTFPPPSALGHILCSVNVLQSIRGNIFSSSIWTDGAADQIRSIYFDTCSLFLVVLWRKIQMQGSEGYLFIYLFEI